MRKILAVLTALMLLVMPAMGTALTMQEAAAGLWNAEGFTADFFLEAGDLEGAVKSIMGENQSDEQTQQMIANYVPAIKELIQALGLHVEASMDLQKGNLALTLNGGDALDAAWTLDDTQAAVQSSWLGEAPLAFGWDELRELTQSGSGANFDFGAYINGIKEYATDLINNATSRGVNELNILPKTAEYVNGILEKAEKAPAEQSDDCDPAAEAWTISLTRADLQGIVDAFLSDVVELPFFAPVLNAAGMDGATFIAKVDESLQESLEKIVEPVVISMLVDAEGKAVKAGAAIVSTDEEDPALVTFRMVRNTAEGDQKTYDIVVEAYEGEELQVQMNAQVTAAENHIQAEVTMKRAEDGQLNPALAMSYDYTATESEDAIAVRTVQEQKLWQPSTRSVTGDDGESKWEIYYPEEPSMVLRTEGSSVVQQTADGFTVKSDSAFIVPTISENALFTVHGIVKSAPAPAALNTENAIHLLKMSQEELDAFLQNLSTNAQTKLVTLIQQLPQSVLTLIMQTAQ